MTIRATITLDSYLGTFAKNMENTVTVTLEFVT